MSWIFLAVIGHLANGIAFAIDKILLRSAFSRSATYAGIVGILSTVVLFLIPFVSRWPQGSFFWVAIVSGVTFILALWAFFAALARAEASRVVPIVGSLIPMLTLAGTFLFLAERLSDKTFIGFIFLIVATVILSSGGKGKPSGEAIWLSITSSILFAIASVTAKAVYDDAGFLGSFITTRIAAVITSAFLLLVIDRRAGLEVLSMVHPAHRHATSRTKQPGKIAALLALVGQTLGAGGFIFVQWATSQGSASIVNALQAVQYAFLVLAALVLRKRAPQLLGENLTAHVLILKSVALGLTAIGLALIV